MSKNPAPNTIADNLCEQLISAIVTGDIAQGSKIKVLLNGVAIVDADIAPFQKGKATPDGKKHPGLSNAKGHIGFLGHGSRVAFRNLEIRDLD